MCLLIGAQQQWQQPTMAGQQTILSAHTKLHATSHNPLADRDSQTSDVGSNATHDGHVGHRSCAKMPKQQSIVQNVAGPHHRVKSTALLLHTQ